MSRATKRKLRQALKNLDEARAIAEESQAPCMDELGLSPCEVVLPWQDYDETVRRLGGCAACGMSLPCMCEDDRSEAIL